MSITAGSVFKSLSPDARQALLSALVIPYDSEAGNAEDITGLELSKRQRAELEETLQKIALLGLEENANLLHVLLADAGWSADNFSQSISARDRACFLRVEDDTAFEYAIQCFNNSRLTSRESQESGFRLNGIELNFDDIAFDNTPLPKNHPLHIRLESALKTLLKGKELIAVRLSRRLDFYLDDPRDGHEIQCNLSFGDDPIGVEINVDGKEVKESFSFLSRIAALIDLNAQRLFIGCESQSNKLRVGLAKALVEHFCKDQVELQRLHPIKVFPDRLRSQPVFNIIHTDRLESVRVSSIWYRIYGASNNVTRNINVSGTADSLYDLADVQADRSKLRIYRGKIDFYFKPTDGKNEPIKRTIALNEPKTISYGRAFPEQRKIIDRILVEAGLMDQSDEPDPRTDIPSLARFKTPQLLSEARSSLGTDTIDALCRAGFLRPAPSADTAWCDACGQTHDVREEFLADGVVLRCDCINEQNIVQPEDTETVQLDIDVVLRTIIKGLDCDQTVASALNDQTWFLGKSYAEDKRKPFGVMVSIDFNKKENYEAFLEQTWKMLDIDRGIVLSLSQLERNAPLWQSWKQESLSVFLSIDEQVAAFRADKVKQYISGKPDKKARAKKQDWDEFFELYKRTRTGLGHYEEADRMLRDYPEDCPAKRDRLAQRLKDEFPNHFDN